MAPSAFHIDQNQLCIRKTFKMDKNVCNSVDLPNIVWFENSLDKECKWTPLSCHTWTPSAWKNLRLQWTVCDNQSKCHVEWQHSSIIAVLAKCLQSIFQWNQNDFYHGLIQFHIWLILAKIADFFSTIENVNVACQKHQSFSDIAAVESFAQKIINFQASYFCSLFSCWICRPEKHDEKFILPF